VIQYKKELEYKIAYYRHSNYYAKLKQDLQNLDTSKCNEYEKLKNVKFKIVFKFIIKMKILFIKINKLI